jgi:ribonuclease HII
VSGRLTCSSEFERRARRQGFSLIAGLDEAGRGCLFGPVCAAAVILDPHRPIRGLDDSKRLDPARREVLAARIRERATAWAVAFAEAREIDRINIYQASRLAMRRALEALRPQPDFLLTDAMRIESELPQMPLIHGDALSVSIAAASILAKTARDLRMAEWHERYPEFGLARHKGYGTPEHLRALSRFGPTPEHRLTFAPVRQAAGYAPKQESLW